MLYFRYLIGGQAELSAADCVFLDDMVTAQEGGVMKLGVLQHLQVYLIDAMRQISVDQARNARVPSYDAGAKQAKGWA